MKKHTLYCPLCRTELDAGKSFVSACTQACSQESHVLEANIAMQKVPTSTWSEKNANPYLVFGESMIFQHLAQKLGVDYSAVVNFIADNLVNNCQQPNFHITPLQKVQLLPDLPELYIKNETANVSGSHKARHLMGTTLYLEILRRAKVLKDRPSLAVYSCGNAGFAASVLAKAAHYPLQVFVPDNVHVNIERGLLDNGADVRKMSRQAGESGDPCYKAFGEALAAGALAFSCSGPDNWSNIEGGKTIAWELFSQMAALGQSPDIIFVQTGGGALGSAIQQASKSAFQAGLLEREPAIMCVQTEAAFPLVRSWLLALQELCHIWQLTCPFSGTDISHPAAIQHIYSSELDFLQMAVKKIKQSSSTDLVSEVLRKIGRNMPNFMWEWESAPHSIAHGILDDITYDWLSLLFAHFRTGGIPVVVNEQDLCQANDLALSKTDIPVDHTGTSGLAGLLAAKRYGMIHPESKIALLFTGRKR